jgi:hypothetical protein
MPEKISRKEHKEAQNHVGKMIEDKMIRIRQAWRDVQPISGLMGVDGYPG